jgi:Glycosyltransferase
MHGLAAVNAEVRRRLQVSGVPLQVLNIAASGLQRGVFARLGRLPRVLGALVSLAFAPRRRGQALYLSISGGLGQVYEVLFAVLGRVFGMRLFFHHHSYAYLDRRSRITAALTRLGGMQAMHIVLSPGMACRLQTEYPQVRRVVAVSNAALLLANGTAGSLPRRELARIGFLGNLSAEKGVFVFLDVCGGLLARGHATRCLLAGPFQDARTELLVLQRLAKLPNVDYIGPQYGKDKEDFYQRIDALLFPTQYANEAEPLVIHEALAAGAPVIAWNRGAISEIVDAECGLLVARDADFVAAAITQLSTWRQSPVKLSAASVAATTCFARLREASEGRWDTVQTQLTGTTEI